MKNLSVFYLIIMVLLSSLPCNDELEETSFIQNTVVKVACDLQEEASESCFPICTCYCCGQNIIEVQLANLDLKPIVKLVVEQISNYQSTLQENNSSIWNPPKIS